MSDVRDPDNFPADIKQAIEQVTSIVAGFAGTTFEEDTSGSDSDLIGLSVDQWGLKDFARYFSDKCEELHVPYVLKYARDVQCVKQIKADLSSAGRAANLDLKFYLDWAFDNRQMIVEKDGYFTLGTVQKYVNYFLQTLPDDGNHRPSWGDALGPAMLGEYKTNKLMGLLVRFGIPLAAIFLKHAGFSDERVKQGLASRLTELAADGRHLIVAKIARATINLSPYPEGFPMRDWRSAFADIWDISGCRSQSWWRDADYGGMPYVEYDAFLMPGM